MCKGKQLKAYIEEAGLNVSEVARRSGINPQTLYTAVRNNSVIRLDTAIALSKVLNCQVSDICDNVINDNEIQNLIVTNTDKQTEAKLHELLEIYLKDSYRKLALTSLLDVHSKLNIAKQKEVQQFVEFIANKSL